MFAWVGSQLKTNRFMSSVLVLAGSTFLAQAIAVLAAPILTRLYSPADFGTFSIYSSCLSLVLISAGFRYELGIPLARSEVMARSLSAIACMGVMFLSTLSVAAGVASQVWLSNLFQVTITSGVMALFAMSLLFGGFYQVGIMRHVRNQRFISNAASKLSQSITQTSSQVVLGFSDAGSMGLFISDVFGRTVGAISIWLRLGKAGRHAFTGVSMHSIRRAAMAYRQLPLVSLWSALLNQSSNLVPNLMFAACYGIYEAGLLSLTQRLLAIPCDLIIQSVAPVYAGEAGRILRTEPGKILTIYLRTAAGIFLLAFIPTLAIAILGPTVFKICFGEGWVKAGEYARILSFGLLARLTVSPMSQTLNFVNKHHQQLILDFIRLIAMIGTVYLPFLIGLPSENAILSYSLGIVGTQLAGFLITIYYLRSL